MIATFVIAIVNEKKKSDERAIFPTTIPSPTRVSVARVLKYSHQDRYSTVVAIRDSSRTTQRVQIGLSVIPERSSRTDSREINVRHASLKYRSTWKLGCRCVTENAGMKSLGWEFNVVSLGEEIYAVDTRTRNALDTTSLR